jgi:hypothetical protein
MGRINIGNLKGLKGDPGKNGSQGKEGPQGPQGVQGPQGPAGGPPGTKLFSVNENISAAPSGSRAGDWLVNGSAKNITVAGKSLTPGDYVEIETLSPFKATNVSGNLKGPQGAQGLTGPQGPKGQGGDVGRYNFWTEGNEDVITIPDKEIGMFIAFVDEESILYSGSEELVRLNAGEVMFAHTNDGDVHYFILRNNNTIKSKNQVRGGGAVRLHCEKFTRGSIIKSIG